MAEPQMYYRTALTAGSVGTFADSYRLEIIVARGAPLRP